MFVVCRKLTGNTRTCALICQSVRDGKKVVQKTIKYYGVAHTRSSERSLLNKQKKEILKLKTSSSKTEKIIYPEEVLIDSCEGALLGHMAERFRMIEGFHAIFGPIFDELKLDSLWV